MPEPISTALIAGGIAAGGSIISGLISSLFGGSDKVMFPVPGNLPDGFLAMRFVDPSISEEHYLDVNTGITYRWSYEGDRFKESGRVDEGFRQTALNLMGSFWDSGVYDPSLFGLVNGSPITFPGQGTLMPFGGDITSIMTNAGFGAFDNPFLPTEKGDPLIWTKAGLNLAAQVVGTLLQQLIGGKSTGITRVMQNAIGRATRPASIPPMFLELGLLDMGNTVLESVGAKASEMIDAVVQPIKDVFIGVADTVMEETGAVLRTIGDGLDTAVGWVTTFVNDTIASVQGAFSTIGETITNTFNGVVDFIYATIGDIAGFIADTFNSVIEFFQGLYNTAIDFIQEVGQAVIDNARQTIQLVTEFAVFVADQVTQAFNKFLEGADSVIGTLRTGLEALPEVIIQAGKEYQEFYKDAFSVPLFERFGPVGEALQRIIEADANVVKAEPMTVVNDWLSSVVGDVPALREITGWYARIQPSSTLGQLVLGALTSLFLFTALTQGIAEAKALKISQEYALDNPYRLPTPEQLVEGTLRGIVDDTLYDDQIRRQGLTSQSGALFRKTRENLPPAQSLIDWKFRGFITEGEVDSVLKREGWTDEFIGHIKQAGFVLPSVQDLITMAVREVFTPDVAENFGQFQDFPQAFAENAAKLGLTEEWAKNYWAAHWNLPSPQMGFEMLHRRVITREELDILLRALDVMPFWRDKLTQISFSPLTRVDIRRMHKLGVLTDEQVYESYLDLGYDEVNARRLQFFVSQLNAPQEELDDVTLKEATRSDILRAYTLGIITRTDTTDLLAKAGYSNDSIILMLESTDFRLELDEREQAVKSILEQAQAGVLTFEQAEDKLAQQGLETVEMTRALTKLTRLQAQRVKQPSRSELDRMLKLRVIDDVTYLSEMSRLGYSDVWATRYMQMVRLGQGEV